VETPLRQGALFGAPRNKRQLEDLMKKLEAAIVRRAYRIIESGP